MSIQNRTLNLDTSLRPKGGLSNELSELNPFLKRREIVVEEDTGKIKIGDGINTWNNLPYIGDASSYRNNNNDNEGNIDVTTISMCVLGIENEPVLIPAVGDQYIVGDSPTGVFSNAAEGTIAIYSENNTNWEFISPVKDICVINIQNGQILKYNGSEWINIGSITIQNNVKFLQSINADTPKSILYSTDLWDYDDFDITAQYSTGVNHIINNSLSLNITQSCNFSLDGNSQIINGQPIELTGEHNICVQYTENGRSANINFTQNILEGELNNAFLPYFVTRYTSGQEYIYLQSFNSDYYRNNPTTDIVVQSRVIHETLTGNKLVNVVLGINSYSGNYMSNIPFIF